MRKIERLLGDGGYDVETAVVSAKGEVRRLAGRARDEAYDMVVCVGGDGTIRETINGIAGSETALGILPAGTGNVLAWELGIPLDPLRACRILLSGERRRMDLCKANDTYFCCMAGVGFDAQVVKELSPSFKGLFGIVAYPISGLRTLMHYNMPELDIRIDSTDGRKGYAVVVCNSSHYGGKYKMCPEARIDDGMMNVCVLKKRDAMAILRSRLYEQEQQRVLEEQGAARRSQVGSGDRSEKIRTYNFPQNRVTDHRIGFTSHRLENILEGDLDELIQALAEADQSEKLKELAAA